MIVDFKRASRLLHESFWIITGQITAVLGSFVLIRICTDNLTLAQYGELAIALSIAMVINQVISGGVTSSVGRHYSIALEKNQLSSYFSGSVVLIAGSFGLMLICCFLVALLLVYSDNQEWLTFLVIVTFLSMFNALNATMAEIQNAARKRLIVAVHAGTDAWLRVLFAVIFFIILDRSSEIVALAYLTAALVIACSHLYFLGLTLPISKVMWFKSTENKWFQSIWRQAWPLSFWGIFTAIQLGSDRWALGHFSSLEMVGAYAVLYQVGFVPMTLLGGVLTKLLGPIVFQKAGDATDLDRIEEVFKITKNAVFGMLTVTLLISFAAYFWHDIVLKLLVNEAFRAFSYLLPIMVLAGGFQSCHHLIGLRITSGLSVRKIMVPQIVFAILFCILNSFGAYIGDLNGLVLCFLLGSLVSIIWIVFYSERIKIHKFLIQ
ncbi:oligosaccharide flippase family protein [Amylibacter sp.]|nr:oligosaccharide flippase family protein [Amylibacter sp.]